MAASIKAFFARERVGVGDAGMRCKIGQCVLRFGGLHGLARRFRFGAPACGRCIARAGQIGLRRRPGGPSGGRAAGIFQMDAVHRADRYTELAAGAIGLDDGVHLFVRAEDGVGRAGINAQGAADAPCLVHKGHAARALDAVLGVERLERFATDGRQPRHAFFATGRTLVDVGLALRDSIGIGRAVRVAAAGALCLRQRIQ